MNRQLFQSSLLGMLIYSSVVMGAADLEKKAEAFLEAGDPEQARIIWEEMLDPSLPDWKRDFIRYNIGVSYLSENDFDQAIEQFQSIELNNQSSPLLRERVKTNLGIAWIRQAEDDEEIKTDRFTYKEAIREIDQAIDASCQLQKLEGAQECLLDENLENVRRLAKEQLSLLSVQDQPDLSKDVPQLFTSLRTANHALSFLKKIQVDPYLNSRYHSFWIETLNTWTPLWESVELQIPENEDFTRAKQGFLKGLQALQKKKFEESREQMQMSMQTLRKLVRDLLGDDPILEQLQELLDFYARALDQTPIQESSLYEIETEQNRIQDLVNLKEAQAYLRESLSAVESNADFRARFFLEQARYIIRRKMREIVKREDLPVKTILQDAIDDQEHAVNVHRLIIESKDLENGFTEILHETQENALETAEPFLDQVIEKQKIEYQKTKIPIPWEEVLDSFQRGLYSAQDAKQLLEKNVLPSQALLRQEKALKYWQEALRKLEPPSAVEAKPEEIKESVEEGEGVHSIEEVLRNLQEMEKDDRQPRQEVEKKIEVPYPW